MLPVTSFFRIFKRTVVTNRPMLTKLLVICRCFPLSQARTRAHIHSEHERIDTRVRTHQRVHKKILQRRDLVQRGRWTGRLSAAVSLQTLPHFHSRGLLFRVARMLSGTTLHFNSWSGPVIDMYIEPATIRCRAGMDMNWGTNCRASSAADLCLYSV